MDIRDVMTEEELEATGVLGLSAEQQAALVSWAVRTYSLGKTPGGEIEGLKYGGHLVILDDGSRWEVDDVDASTSEMWSEGDRVVIIDGVMYNLADAEYVDVTEEV